MTEFITKSKEAAGKYGGKAAHGLSGAAIIWMLATFVTVKTFESHDRDCSARQAESWREIQDIQVILMQHATAKSGLTNTVAGGRSNP